MHVGLSVIFQNPGETKPDRDIYAEELVLAKQAEPLGFDSIWSVEHHFTDYTMCPNVFQFLTYMAGCTEKIQLGSMIHFVRSRKSHCRKPNISNADTLDSGSS